MAQTKLDPAVVRQQIEMLRVTHPRLEEGDGDDWLLSLASETDFTECLTAAVDRLQDAGAKADGIDRLITELKARQDRFEHRVDAMRTLAFKLMQAAEVRKVELPAATLSIRAGTQRVVVTDEDALPPDCVRIKREPDKTAIKNHLAHGEPVAGAEMSNAEPVLSVRIK